MTTKAWSYLSAQALHYLFFALRSYEYRRSQAGLGARRWPAFGVPGDRAADAAADGVPGEDVPAGAVALTIDDGPHPEWTPRMLDLLARHDVTATFFLIGARVRERPDLARRIRDAGHTVGNHSMHHPQPFAARSTAAIHDEIARTQREVENAVGATPRLFRAPGGNWSPRVLAIAADEGLTAVDWTVNPSDWRSPGTEHIARTLSGCRPGQILLCHDGGGDRSQTVEALETVIPHLLARGLRLVTPAMPPTLPDATRTQRDPAPRADDGRTRGAH